MKGAGNHYFMSVFFAAVLQGKTAMHHPVNVVSIARILGTNQILPVRKDGFQEGQGFVDFHKVTDNVLRGAV